MKIQREKLLDILNKVKPGLSSKELVASMSYLYFSGKDIITYNDKICIQYPFKTEFNLFIKANNLYNLLLKSTTEVIALTEKQNKLNITSKKFKANLTAIKDSETKSRIEYISESLKGVTWKTLPDNFSDSVSLCSFTAAKYEVDTSLVCVYLNKDMCFSTDNSRISYAVLDREIDEMLILASEIKSLIALNPIEYSITTSWIHFKNKENCIFSIRKIEGKFPDCLPLFDFKGVTINLPKEILEGIDITSVLLNEEHAAINVKIEKNQCLLSIKTDAGKVQYKAKLKYSGTCISFNINSKFFKSLINYSSTIVYSEKKIKIQTDNGFSLLTALYAKA